MFSWVTQQRVHRRYQLLGLGQFLWVALMNLWPASSSRDFYPTTAYVWRREDEGYLFLCVWFFIAFVSGRVAQKQNNWPSTSTPQNECFLVLFSSSDTPKWAFLFLLPKTENHIINDVGLLSKKKTHHQIYNLRISLKIIFCGCTPDRLSPVSWLLPIRLGKPICGFKIVYMYIYYLAYYIVAYLYGADDVSHQVVEWVRKSTAFKEKEKKCWTL
jgi:hypothetical protein